MLTNPRYWILWCISTSCEAGSQARRVNSMCNASGTEGAREVTLPNYSIYGIVCWNKLFYMLENNSMYNWNNCDVNWEFKLQRIFYIRRVDMRILWMVNQGMNYLRMFYNLDYVFTDYNINILSSRKKNLEKLWIWVENLRNESSIWYVCGDDC